ncbi:hypothetical protein [Paraburkholderia sp. HD33-4]|uniref:hypothetical protein n=1 Tax=Paraburkholderia sp. HD33-4 TaxID=2883242 RepID=UPI001F2A22A2|nr:hypothetical protein [Paraburkholderia sp. HD33-4]
MQEPPQSKEEWRQVLCDAIANRETRPTEHDVILRLVLHTADPSIQQMREFITSVHANLREVCRHFGIVLRVHPDHDQMMRDIERLEARLPMTPRLTALTRVALLSQYTRTRH